MQKYNWGFFGKQAHACVEGAMRWKAGFFS